MKFEKLVKESPSAIALVPKEERTEPLLIYAAHVHPSSIIYMEEEERTPYVCRGCFRSPYFYHPDEQALLKAHDDIFEESIEKALQVDATCLAYVKNPTPRMIEIALRGCPSLIGIVKKPTEEQQCLAVALDAKTLFNIRHPTRKAVQSAMATKEDADAILAFYDEKKSGPDYRAIVEELDLKLAEQKRS